MTAAESQHHAVLRDGLGEHLGVGQGDAGLSRVLYGEDIVIASAQFLDFRQREIAAELRGAGP